ncbi:MAG TPA: hypothetical protein VFE62_21060 [Gemmataceae bacterium]|nr:hypothetical protein [Gemmataceae bacterium]
MKQEAKEKPAPKLSIYLDPRLIAIIQKDAKSRKPPIPTSEAAAQAIAKAYGRPDLGAVPRKKRGRKKGTVRLSHVG